MPSQASATYNGTYTVPGGRSAMMILTVNPAGSISGTVVDTVSGQTTFAASGTLDNAGNFYLMAPFSTGTDYFSGRVTISNTGMLTGSVAESGQVNQEVNLLLRRG